MITFREFMELALYFPVQGGYYTDPGTRAARDDYYTSPAAHPAFGAAIAIQLRSMWRALVGPSSFQRSSSAQETGFWPATSLPTRRGLMCRSQAHSGT